MAGLATCYDSDTGKELWKERLQGTAFTASPIAAGGLVYFVNEAGETIVLEPGPALKVVAQNSLGAAKGQISGLPPRSATARSSSARRRISIASAKAGS